MTDGELALSNSEVPASSGLTYIRNDDIPATSGILKVALLDGGSGEACCCGTSEICLWSLSKCTCNNLPWHGTQCQSNGFIRCDVNPEWDIGTVIGYGTIEEETRCCYTITSQLFVSPETYQTFVDQGLVFGAGDLFGSCSGTDPECCTEDFDCWYHVTKCPTDPGTLPNNLYIGCLPEPPPVWIYYNPDTQDGICVQKGSSVSVLPPDAVVIGTGGSSFPTCVDCVGAPGPCVGCFHCAGTRTGSLTFDPIQVVQNPNSGCSFGSFAECGGSTGSWLCWFPVTSSVQLNRSPTNSCNWTGYCNKEDCGQEDCDGGSFTWSSSDCDCCRDACDVNRCNNNRSGPSSQASLNCRADGQGGFEWDYRFTVHACCAPPSGADRCADRQIVGLRPVLGPNDCGSGIYSTSANHLLTI